MYLHIGQGVVVTKESIIGVFDLDNTTSSYLTRNYLNGKEKDGCVVALGDELPKSFIVTNEKGGDTVYLSQLSSQTLFKRCEELGIE